MMLLEKPIKTDRLILKNLTQQDAQGSYLEWLHDPKVNQFLEVRHRLPDSEALSDFISRMNASKDNLLLGIYLLDGKHIGNIKLGPIHTLYSRAHLGLLIGDHAEWGKGFATEAIGALTHYAFERLNLSAIWAGCYANNQGSCKAFLKAGYTESARQLHYWKVNDDFVDNILLVKLRDYDRTSA